MPNHPIAVNLALIVHRLVTEPRGWRVDRLLADLAINARTYRKYRQVLRAAFPPFRRGGRSLVAEVADGDARWLRLLAPPESDAAFGALARVAAHHLARAALGFLGDADLARALADAAAEFDATVASRRATLRHLRANAGRLLHVAPDAPKDYRGHRATIDEVLRALTYLQRVRITYAAPGRPARPHRLEPLTLVVHRGALYLLARYPDGPRRGVCSFALERVRSIERLREHFAYPPATEHDPARLFADAFGVFLPRAPRSLAVELLFARSPWLHEHLRARRWAPSQRFEALADGRLRMRFRAASLVEVEPWVRQWGDAVEVVGPPELREALTPRGRRATRRAHPRARG